MRVGGVRRRCLSELLAAEGFVGAPAAAFGSGPRSARRASGAPSLPRFVLLGLALSPGRLYHWPRKSAPFGVREHPKSLTNRLTASLTVPTPVGEGAVLHAGSIFVLTVVTLLLLCRCHC